MKLSFFGAAHAVTGSCHCLEVGGKKILIDCGLQQGRDEHDDNALDFSPSYIDYVIVTHAHIDHSGRIPLLVKEGFQGQIFTTRLTGELLSIMLRDSAFIQESDAQWQNQKGKRAGRPEVEPLYTVADAEAALEQIFTVEYGQTLDLCEGVKIRFRDAGHLLGSAEIELWCTENGIFEGYGNGKFGPMDAVTREQLAAVLYRYTEKYLDMDASSRVVLKDVYRDYEKISRWAEDGMSWASATGLMEGYPDGTVRPRNGEKRSEIAAMFHRYCVNILDV